MLETPLLFKVIILSLLLFVLISLGQALMYLIKDDGRSDRVVKALTWRIGVSVLIFILLLLGSVFGLIQPHGLAG